MIGIGLLAGTAGTVALDAFTYFDMAASGRPASEVPSKVVAALAENIGVDSLAHGDDDDTKNRRTGFGALSGYGVGIGSGVVYAAMRPSFRWLPWPVAGVILGCATLLLSEGSATKLGATDWSTWTTSDWISDIVPRSLYGLTVAFAVERMLDA